MQDQCELSEFFSKAEQIRVWEEGEAKEFSHGSELFQGILYKWNEMIKDSFQMPAFGVSIDKLTREEMKKGLWVEFLFNKDEECNGMPFSKLLIAIQPDYCGFNVVRYWEDGYNGRCFYLDLQGKNMTGFYEYLKQVI